MNINDLDDAEKFQELFVKPLVDAVRAEIKPLATTTYANRERIKKLESKWTKALLGFAGMSILLGVALDWVKKKLGLIVFLAVLIPVGCALTHSSDIPDSLPAVGSGVEKTDAHIVSAERNVQSAKPHADATGKVLLDNASEEHQDAQSALSEVRVDLRAAQTQRDSLERESTRQAIEIAEVKGGWGYTLQMFVKHAVRWLIGLVILHVVLGAAAPFVTGGVGKWMARIGALINPASWFQSARDNFYFNRRDYAPCP